MTITVSTLAQVAELSHEYVKLGVMFNVVAVRGEWVFTLTGGY